VNNINPLIKPEKVLEVTAGNFNETALHVFRYQHASNSLYRQYCDLLSINAAAVQNITDIPFLPISFFKTHPIKTGNWDKEELLFESSGTTATVNSRHLVKDAGLYTQSLLAGFTRFYGTPSRYTFLALLPSYLERKNASLVYMARQLMEASKHHSNGFYINEWDVLKEKLTELENRGEQAILLGVTFALIDFAEYFPFPLRNTIVMETGGMKGRREEWTRKQIHDLLKQQWQLNTVHSEYGMTELLSQAYSTGDGIYECTSTMKTLVRDLNDPLTTLLHGQGGINIIDLANIHSCSFIATEDVGRVATDGSFEILGRMDHSALRGCSLMAV
jgi:hypothetical protein